MYLYRFLSKFCLVLYRPVAGWWRPVEAGLSIRVSIIIVQQSAGTPPALHIYTYLHISTHIYTYLHISTHIYTFTLTTPQLGTPDPRQSPRSPAPATLPRPSETARPPPRPRPSPRPASKVSECVRCPAPDVQMSTSSHNRNHEIRCSISRTREPLLRLRLQGHQLHGQALLPGRRQGVCQRC